MPHAGLMDADVLGPEKASLMRARLHIRGGKRRLRQRKISAGLVTLPDALSSAMDWYMASPEKRKKLQIDKHDNMKDDKNVFHILKRSGVLSGVFDYEAFDKLVERALDQEMTGYDYSDVLKGIECIATRDFFFSKVTRIGAWKEFLRS